MSDFDGCRNPTIDVGKRRVIVPSQSNRTRVVCPMSFERLIADIRKAVADGESLIANAYDDFGIPPRGPMLEYVPAPPPPLVEPAPPLAPATRLIVLAIIEADRCGRRVAAALALYK